MMTGHSTESTLTKHVPAPTGGIRRWAVLSEDGTYRYALGRCWGTGGDLVTWLMLNPSTADATADDPTIRRCTAFASAWGHDGLVVVNLYALRSTNPALLRTAADPTGPDNDQFLHLYTHAYKTIAAWGSHPMARRRARDLGRRGVLPASLWSHGATSDGSPRHPLYVPRKTGLALWTEDGANGSTAKPHLQDPVIEGDSGISALRLRLLTLLAEGHTVSAIARQLGISERTVRRTVQQLCQRVGCRDRTHLIAWAAINGLIAPDIPKGSAAEILGDAHGGSLQEVAGG